MTHFLLAGALIAAFASSAFADNATVTSPSDGNSVSTADAYPSRPGFRRDWYPWDRDWRYPRYPRYPRYGYDRYNWEFFYIDHHDGCRGCDYTCGAAPCNRWTVGRTMYCHQPGTRDNSIVYICRRY